MLTTTNTKTGWRRAGAALGLALLVVGSGCTPPGPRALLDGEKLLNAGRPSDAVRRLRTAVEFLPANAQAWNHLGLAYHQAGQPTEAVEAYQQALRLDRNLAAAHFNLGCLYLEHNDLGQALDSLWTFVGLRPQSAEGWQKLGQVQLRLKKWDQAERSLVAALRFNPGDYESLNGLGIAHQQRRRYREAWQCFTNALGRQPNFAPAWLNLAVAAHQAGSRPQAVQAYRKFASLRPEEARVLQIDEVLRQFEPPPPAPTLQLPNLRPAAPTTATNAAPAASVPPAVVTNARPVAPTNSVAPPPARTNAEPAAHTRPPPRQAEVESPRPNPSPTSTAPAPTAPTLTDTRPAVVAPAPAVATPEISRAAPKPAPPTNSAPVVLSSTVELPVSVAPRSNAGPASRSDATSAPPTSTVASTVPVPVPRPPAASEASSPLVTAPAPAPAAPAESVQLPPELPLAAQVKDETPAAPPPASAASPAASGPANLVRPVSGQRAAAGDAADRRGFWSRANPIGWFGADEKAPAESAASRTNANLAAAATDKSDAARWRWTKPTSWFRGEEPRPNPPTNRPPESPAAPLVVASASPTTRPAPAAPVPAPVAPRPAPKRYQYLNPTQPAAGDRAAAREVMARGWAEQQRERYAAAAELYREAARLDPTVVEAQQNLAIASLHTGDLPAALSASERALVLKPDSSSARLNFALALDRAEFPVDAVAEAEKVAAAHPNDVAAHLLLANLYAQRLDQPERARPHYRRVIELEPEHPQSVAIRRWLAGLP